MRPKFETIDDVKRHLDQRYPRPTLTALEVVTIACEIMSPEAKRKIAHQSTKEQVAYERRFIGAAYCTGCGRNRGSAWVHTRFNSRLDEVENCPGSHWHVHEFLTASEFQYYVDQRSYFELAAGGQLDRALAMGLLHDRDQPSGQELADARSRTQKEFRMMMRARQEQR